MNFWGRRVTRLPDNGVLIFATDLHGNYRDYCRLRDIYDTEESAGNRPVLVFCGDLVHGPNPEMNQPGAWPSHLGSAYTDESAALIRDYLAFSKRARTVCLLGNHEHSHIGGPPLSKFYLDEAGVLDRALGRDAQEVRRFFRSFPLIAWSPCGAVFTHGAPSATEANRADFESLQYDGYESTPIFTMALIDTVGALLWSRSAQPSQARAFLDVLSDDDRMQFVAYGHDIVHIGYDKIGLEQICGSACLAWPV